MTSSRNNSAASPQWRKAWRPSTKPGIAFSLEGFAGLWAARGSPKRAVRMRSAADRLRESAGLPLPDLDREMYDHYIRAAEESLGEQAYRSACLEGRAISLDAAIREALSDS